MELRHPKTEVHLCQLAVFENFAEHGLYVKFTNEEAEQLESEALALALDMSLREAGMQGWAVQAFSAIPYKWAMHADISLIS